MIDLKEILIPVQREMEDLEKAVKFHLASKVPFVESVVDYVIKNGGKRLRPLLTVLGARLSGYSGSASVNLGAAVEFMHTASLLHDDVLDNAGIRRGRATTNVKWGNHVSVLVGDFFYCRAMDILVSQGDIRILRVITDAITTTTEGEILEITKSNDVGTTRDDYLKVIDGKTAALFGASCQIGAILGNVSSEFEKALHKFGFKLGMAFQLMDDVLDYTSAVEEFGKASGTDLREGKLTLPLIIALEQCRKEEAQKIKNVLISDSTTSAHFNEIFQIVERYGGISGTISLAQSFVTQAKEELAVFKPSLEKETLLSIADYVLLRKN
ncbi:MAG: polyprenyl synthetase family protein [Deltaproteobacteria bacterium]|nr:polyprenyl synthetase family protein [Deltaproteobacteria bacterium]